MVIYVRIPLMLAVAVVIGCFPDSGSSQAAEFGHFPLPTEPGVTIEEVKAAVTTAFSSDEALDSVDAAVNRGPEWRQRSYVIEVPGPGVNVRYTYHRESGKVWGVRVAYATGRYNGAVGGIPFDSNVRDVIANFGQPTLRRSLAPVVDEYVWDRETDVLIVEAYSRRYDDIAISGDVGAITSLETYSKDLAPEGYVGYEPPN